jgi:hypothetical protein
MNIYMCDLTGKEALSMNRQLHDQRIRTNGIPSPETKCMHFIFTAITFFQRII